MRVTNSTRKEYHIVLDLPWLNYRYPFVINHLGNAVAGEFNNSAPRTRSDYPRLFAAMRRLDERKFSISWKGFESVIPQARARWDTIPEEKLSLALYETATPRVGRGAWIVSANQKAQLAALEPDTVIAINCSASLADLREFGECFVRLQLPGKQRPTGENLLSSVIGERLRMLWPDLAIVRRDPLQERVPDWLTMMPHHVYVGVTIDDAKRPAREQMLYSSPNAMRAVLLTFANRYNLTPADVLPPDPYRHEEKHT